MEGVEQGAGRPGYSRDHYLPPSTSFAEVLAVVEVVEVHQVGHLLWHMDSPPPPPSLALWREREHLGVAGVRFVFPCSENDDEVGVPEDGWGVKKEEVVAGTEEVGVGGKAVMEERVEEVLAHREVLVGASRVFCAHLGVEGSYRDQGEVRILDAQPAAFARSGFLKIERKKYYKKNLSHKRFLF